MSISVVTASRSSLRCEPLSDETTVARTLWAPSMGIRTSTNVRFELTFVPHCVLGSYSII